MSSPTYTTCPWTGQELDYTVSIITMPEGIPRWNLVSTFLAFRKQVFVDRKNWSLAVHQEIEFEQYDVGHPHYVIAHRGNAVLGGGRLRRTSDMTGNYYRYMIYDAWAGRLSGMPTDLCIDEPPVNPDIWEFTRFAVLPTERGVADTVMYVVNDYLAHLKAKSCLFLSSPAMLRFATRIGFEPTPLGKTVGNKDGRFLAFSCNVNYANIDSDQFALQ